MTTNRIVLVTPPDDVIVDGIRLLLIGLTNSHSALISNRLKNYEGVCNIIIYIANNPSDTQWILEKKIKSDLIIFNAESENQTLVGYFAALPNSYYFGMLRDLNSVNNRVIFTEEDFLEILNLTIGSYERKF